MLCPSRLVATTAGATPTTTTVFPRFGLIHRQGPAVELLAVEGLNRCLGFRVTSHLHEAKSFGPACVAVHDNLRRLYCAPRTAYPDRCHSRCRIGCLRTVSSPLQNSTEIERGDTLPAERVALLP